MLPHSFHQLQRLAGIGILAPAGIQPAAARPRILIDEHDLRAIVGRRKRGGETRGAGTDHQHIGKRVGFRRAAAA